MADIILKDGTGTPQTFENVASITVPKSGGGTAKFSAVSGNIHITQNGTGIDVSSYETASVSVSASGGSNIDFGVNIGDTLDTIYFNTKHDTSALDAVLANASYPNTSELAGITMPWNNALVCTLGTSSLYVHIGDLSAMQAGTYIIYVMQSETPTVLYSTKALDASAVIPGMVITPGWQVSKFSIGATVTVSDILEDLLATKDNYFARMPQAYGEWELPQLYAPTISINDRILTITNSTENGSFANGYKVLSGGAVIAETSEIQVDLFTTSIAHTTAQVSVVAKGTKFNDSDQSAPETYTAHYTVSEYDGETLLNTEVVKSGTMPSYTPKKSGYVFVEWKDVNGNKVTSITENISIYATWKKANTIKAGDYVAIIGQPFPAYAGYVNVWYDLGTFDARKTDSETNPTGTIDSPNNYTGLTKIQFYEYGSNRRIYSLKDNAYYVNLASFNDKKVISRVEYGIRFNSDQQVDNTQYNLFKQYFKKI